MSSHENRESAERKGSSTKRISTLNDHEDHLLRRRINAYQKIHNKEIAGVSSQLEEIRDSMKALVTDPLYGTHALNDSEVDKESPPRSPVTNKGRKSKLRRTQSFPELLDGSNDGSSGVSPSSFPALKSEHPSAARLVAKYGETKAVNLIKSRSRSVTLHHLHDSVQFGNEASDWQKQAHKKLERSKTAPVAMLQPLLKTTPEMMRKKIHISTSNRLSTEEFSARRGLSARLSPRFGDSIIHPSHLQQNQADLENCLHRPKPTPDSQFPVKQTSHSVHESRTQSKPVKDVPTKRAPAKAEQEDVAFVSLQPIKSQGHKSSNKGISKTIYKLNDKKAEDVEDLRNCRYLRFSKERQESNRI